MAAPHRAYITTHVLDQMTGKPAGGLVVELEAMGSEGALTVEKTFVGRTAADSGRIEAWTAGTAAAAPSSAAHTAKPDELSAFVEQRRFVPHKGDWRLRFYTSAYFVDRGMDPFYPAVEVLFSVDRGRAHTHVPLLLGPFGYTTYRGT